MDGFLIKSLSAKETEKELNFIGFDKAYLKTACENSFRKFLKYMT